MKKNREKLKGNAHLQQKRFTFLQRLYYIHLLFAQLIGALSCKERKQSDSRTKGVLWNPFIFAVGIRTVIGEAWNWKKATPSAKISLGKSLDT